MSAKQFVDYLESKGWERSSWCGRKQYLYFAYESEPDLVVVGEVSENPEFFLNLYECGCVGFEIGHDEKAEFIFKD